MLFKTLMSITLGYTALVMLMLLTFFIYEVSVGFDFGRAKRKMCAHISVMPGASTFLFLPQFVSWTFVVAWIVLVAPFINPWVNGPEYISTFGPLTEGSHFLSYLGPLADEYFNSYYAALLVTTLGAKGVFFVLDIVKTVRESRTGVGHGYAL